MAQFLSCYTSPPCITLKTRGILDDLDGFDQLQLVVLYREEPNTVKLQFKSNLAVPTLVGEIELNAERGGDFTVLDSPGKLMLTTREALPAVVQITFNDVADENRRLLRVILLALIQSYSLSSFISLEQSRPLPQRNTAGQASNEDQENIPPDPNQDEDQN